MSPPSLTKHLEKHFISNATVRDIVIGMADGLTVPFALAAGLTAAVEANNLIVKAGFAEIAAGSIAMGLGGYLATKSEVEHYANERKREELEIVEKFDFEIKEVADIFEAYGVPAAESQKVALQLSKDPKGWVDFMMRFELNLEQPDPNRVWQSALTIALSYIVGGLIPLCPYIFMQQPKAALNISAISTLLALLVFGSVKSKFLGSSPLKGALQTMFIGALAASAAFILASLLT